MNENELVRAHLFRKSLRFSTRINRELIYSLLTVREIEIRRPYKVNGRGFLARSYTDLFNKIAFKTSRLW